MESRTRKFLEILRIELQDLIYDLELSEDILEKRLNEHQITEYVYMENLSLLKKEILGIERIKRMLSESDVQINSIEELREKLESYFHDEIKSAGLPNVVFLLVNRKLEKIVKYMYLD